MYFFNFEKLEGDVMLIEMDGLISKFRRPRGFSLCPSDIILVISVIKEKNKILVLGLKLLFINRARATNVPGLYLLRSSAVTALY